MTIQSIAQSLKTDDNRMTSHPIFMVRELRGKRMVNVQPCFTLAGAEEYLRQDGHNLKKPDIYVASGHRNMEWQMIREFLMQQA